MQYEMYQHEQQITIADSSNNSQNSNKMKNATYSIKKVLKTFFKKQQNKQTTAQQSTSSSSSHETFEDLDNLRNMQAEQQLYYHEIIENSANEKLSHMVYYDEMPVDDEDQAQAQDIYVPVRFARTEAGTFFWTTNLQPVTCTITPTVDEDLLQPAYCYSNNQYPLMQFQDRWAQA